MYRNTFSVLMPEVKTDRLEDNTEECIFQVWQAKKKVLDWVPNSCLYVNLSYV